MTDTGELKASSWSHGQTNCVMIHAQSSLQDDDEARLQLNLPLRSFPAPLPSLASFTPLWVSLQGSPSVGHLPRNPHISPRFQVKI